MTIQRQQIRNEVRQHRRNLDVNTHYTLSQKLCNNLIRSNQFRNSDHIAVYLTNDGEVDLMPLVEQGWKMKKKFYLPILSPIFHNRLWFAPFNDQSIMVINRFGIAEPDINWRNAKPAYALDLILMPLVAFDLNGNRLGMGGGFYDRTLAYLNQRKVWRRPYLMGTAFEFQCYPKLPSESWDIPMNGIITERDAFTLDMDRST